MQLSLQIIESRHGSYAKTATTATPPMAQNQNVFSTPTQTWNLTWGNATDEEYGKAVQYDSQGNLYLAGQSNAVGEDPVVFITKISPNGEPLINQTYNFPLGAYVEDIWINSTDSLFVVGYLKNSTETDGFVLSVNGTTLNEEWRSIWAYNNAGIEDAITCVIGDANYLYVAGYSRGFSMGIKQSFATQMDYSGQFLANTTWTVTRDEVPTRIGLTHSGIMIGGSTMDSGNATLYSKIYLRFSQLEPIKRFF